MAALRGEVIVGACLLVLVIGRTSLCRAEPPVNKSLDKLQQLYEDRAKTAQDAYLSCQVAYLAGTMGLDQVLMTSNEWTRAKLALCKTKDERIVIMQAHVARERKIEGRIKALEAVNAKGGESDKVARAGLNRVNAEIELELERGGAAAGESR